VKARLDFANRYIGWTTEWSRIIFSDESSFTIFSDGKGVRVWRTKDERFARGCTVPTVQKGGGSVMVWGCMSASGLGPLVQVQGTMDSAQYRTIMGQYLLPYIEHVHDGVENCLFQQDGASSHRAEATQTWFERHQVNLLDFPTRSPDLNPIEVMWYLLELELRKVTPKPTTINDLTVSLMNCWQVLNSTDIAFRLISSMPERVKAVVVSKGYSTPF